MGKHFLDVFVGNMVEYNASIDKEEKTSMKSEAFEQFIAILFLRASDQGKYGKFKMSIAWTIQINMIIP